MNKLFYPPFELGLELTEPQDYGLTRIEISFYSDDLDAEAEFWQPDFIGRANESLDRVLKVLNKAQGVCHHLPTGKLL